MIHAYASNRPWAARAASWCLLCLTMVWGAEPVRAQQIDSPEDMFQAYLNAGTPIDVIRDQLTSVFGPAVATDLVVWYCSPDPGAGCEGSRSYLAWDYFFQGLDAGDSVDQIAAVMMRQSQRFDPYLVTGIAAFWCSPDPGYGCLSTSPYLQAWHWFDQSLGFDPNPANAIERIAGRSNWFLAEMVAAAICGEATCYRDELVGFVAPSVSPQSWIPGPVARPQSSGMQFDTPPKAPVDKRRVLCAAGVLPPSSC